MKINLHGYNIELKCYDVLKSFNSNDIFIKIESVLYMTATNCWKISILDSGKSRPGFYTFHDHEFEKYLTELQDDYMIEYIPFRRNNNNSDVPAKAFEQLQKFLRSKEKYKGLA